MLTHVRSLVYALHCRLAVQNIPKTAAVTVSDLIVYEILLCHRLVLTVQAVELLEELLGAWRVDEKVYNLPSDGALKAVEESA